MNDTKPIDLNSFIKTTVVKNYIKVRGKHSPISEIVNKVSKSLSVKKIYDLRERENHFYVIIVKNYSKHPKLRYFIAISLANNSSDLLVQLARNIAVRNDLKLIQYSIFPKTLRIQLLLLKEIKKVEDYAIFIEKLKTFRKEFRTKLSNLRNLVENE
ncbi:MAG: hypothetical protein ACFE9Q_01660 [Candidatus Hodarchaeota archaeon]